MEKQLLNIQIRTDEDGEKYIDILYNGYNIIQETIYDNELAGKILELVNENRQTNPNETL